MINEKVHSQVSPLYSTFNESFVLINLRMPETYFSSLKNKKKKKGEKPKYTLILINKKIAKDL